MPLVCSGLKPRAIIKSLMCAIASGPSSRCSWLEMPTVDSPMCAAIVAFSSSRGSMASAFATASAPRTWSVMPRRALAVILSCIACSSLFI